MKKHIYKKWMASAMVVFMTATMLPPVSVFAQTGHIHGDDCYAYEQELSCDIPESKGHVHVESCYGLDGQLICGMEETAEHVHDESCYTQVRKLVCDLEETDAEGGLLNEESETDSETDPAAPVTMNMVLKNGQDVVAADKFTVYKDGVENGNPSGGVTAGDLSETAPDLSGENLYFDHAEVNGKRVYEVGALNDIIYYSSFSGALSVLGDDETIGLYYISKYQVTYEDTSSLKTAGDELVQKGNALTFRAKPSGQDKRLNVTVNSAPVSGSIYDSATGEMIFTVENVQEKQAVVITESDAGSYTLTYDNSSIRHGSVTSPTSGQSIAPNGTIEIVMKASGSGVVNYYALNMLVINGYGVTMLPSDANEGDSVTSYLPSGETVVVTLTSEHNGWLPPEYDPVYTITISNIHTDLHISEGNFKWSDRNEIIIKELTGIRDVVGWDSADDKYIQGSINFVYAQTSSTGNEFYFNLLPGYENPQLTVKANGIEVDVANVHFGPNEGLLYDGRTPSFTQDQYQYRFDIPNYLGDNVELFLSATPIQYTVEYRNDKNDNDLIGSPESDFTVVAGQKDTITITSLKPYETVAGFSPNGYVVKGGPADQVYYAGDTVKVADVVAYAQNGTITFVPNWVPTEELGERQITINLYIEDPTTGKDIPADSYLLSVAQGTALFRPDDERGREHIVSFMARPDAPSWASAYSVNDFVLRQGENAIQKVEADEDSLDFHYDVKKGTLTVNFAWGTDEAGTGSLPASVSKEFAIKQAYSLDITKSIPEGYMASANPVTGTMIEEGVTKTVYLYKDADGDNKPDAYTITLTFDAQDADTEATISESGLTTGGILSGDKKTLTYKLVKAGAEGIEPDTYPDIPIVTVTTDGKGWTGWQQKDGTDRYGTYAGKTVGKDATGLTFEAQYDVAEGYETVSIHYWIETGNGDFNNIYTAERLAQPGETVNYTQNSQTGYVTPNEGKPGTITVVEDGENSVNVYYYLDKDNNKKPDTYTLTLTFKGTGHGSWDTTDPMWKNMEEGKDYTYTTESGAGVLKVFLVKTNDKGFDAEEYPSAPKVIPESTWLFDSWQDANGNTYGSGGSSSRIARASGDGITIGELVGENDNDRFYTTVYNEDKNNDKVPDKEQYITVTFRAGDHGTINDQTEQVVKNLLPGYSAYPQAPTVAASNGWVFTGWTPAYNKAGTVESNAEKEQVYTATYKKVENGGNTGGTGDNSNNSNSVNTTPTATQAPVQSSNAATQNTSGSAAQALIPQTGDDSQPMLWVALVGISGVALAALAVYRKKRSDK